MDEFSNYRSHGNAGSVGAGESIDSDSAQINVAHDYQKSDDNHSISSDRTADINSVKKFAIAFGTGITDTNLQQFEASLVDLAQIFAAHREGPKDGAYFIPASFSEAVRHARNIESFSASVLDLDDEVHADETMIRDRLEGLLYFAYSTHTPGRWRIVVPYQKPARPEVHKQICRQLNSRFPGADECNVKDMQLFYLPSHAPGDTPYAFNTLEGGQLLNPDDHIILRNQSSVPCGGTAVSRMLVDAKNSVKLNRPGDRGAWLDGLLKGENLHGNILSIIGSMVAQGLPRDLIVAYFEGMRPKLEQVRGTGRVLELYGGELERMIDDIIAKEGGSRLKAFGPAADGGYLRPQYFDPKLINMPAPARDRLYGTLLQRGVLSVLTGKGGVAKSMVSLAIAVSLAAGRDYVGLSKRDLRPRQVYLLNLEDDSAELQRRLQALVKYHELSDEQLNLLSDNLAIESGYGRRLRLAAESNRDGVVENTALVEELISRAADFDVVILDPLVGFHSVNENSNDAMDAVADIFRRIANEAKAAVLAVHHSHKGATAADPDNAARGASAIVNAARIVVSMTRMLPEEAKKLEIEDQERTRYIRVDDGKNNYDLPAGTATWLHLESVRIEAVVPDTGEAIGEMVGVPELVELRSSADTTKTSLQSVAGAILMREQVPKPKFTASESTTYLNALRSVLDGCAVRTVRAKLNKLFPEGAVRCEEIAHAGRGYWCWREKNRKAQGQMEYFISPNRPSIDKDSALPQVGSLRDLPGENK